MKVIYISLVLVLHYQGTKTPLSSAPICTVGHLNKSFGPAYLQVTFCGHLPQHEAIPKFT